MASLSSLLASDKRPAVVADLANLVDTTISAQSGISGMAMKGALAAAAKVNPHCVSKGIDRLLPDILGDLEPQWQKFQDSPDSDFGAYLASSAIEVTDIILRRTDALAQSLNVAAISKTYSSLRGKAEKIVAARIPELGRIL
ncbi:MAG: hypothetical protein SOW59_06510 [Corynebacterium sp.]|nr:hypothetical protein [Corynebacterium sp.]